MDRQRPGTTVLTLQNSEGYPPGTVVRSCDADPLEHRWIDRGGVTCPWCSLTSTEVVDQPGAADGRFVSPIPRPSGGAAAIPAIPAVPAVTSLAASGSALDTARDWFERFIVPLHPRDLDLLTLWAAHTHFHDVIGTTPRLTVTSPLPESGKTTVLEHLQRLAFMPVQMASVTSPAMITRLLAAGMRTLLIDEVDRTLRPDREGVGELIAILNSGYKRGGSRPTTVPDGANGWRVEELPTFAPVAMAGISPNLPDDTSTRTVTVVLLPDVHGVAEDSDWETIEAEAGVVAQRLADWADSMRASLPSPDLPAGVRGRAKERWRPLWRVAHAAGGRWPERCLALIEIETENLAHDREGGILRDRPAVTLLRSVSASWPENAEHWSTEALRLALTQRDPDLWGKTREYPNGLTVQRIGRHLGQQFGLRTVKASDGTRLGYALVDVVSVCRRLGIPPPGD